MAARRSERYEAPELEVKQFTLSEIDKAIEKLGRRVEEVRGLDPRTIRYDDARVDTAESNIREAIREVFGSRSPEFHEHQFHQISHGALYVGMSEQELQANFAAGIPQTITMLQGLIARLDEKRADALPDTPAATSPRSVPGSTHRIFVVHGRDEATKHAVARFLEKVGLQPIILHEQPNRGRTLIEKFEQNSDVGFAVVLLTPDDQGHLAAHPEQETPRARQNVILELGYFIGRLGRARVCALHKGGVELPSDLHGIVYVSLEGPQNWQILLAKEIKAAGMAVDLNRVI